jgi:hypothetical protein
MCGGRRRKESRQGQARETPSARSRLLAAPGAALPRDQVQEGFVEAAFAVGARAMPAEGFGPDRQLWAVGPRVREAGAVAAISPLRPAQLYLGEDKQDG